MAHIKVPEQTPKVSYTVTTAEDTFNINFVIFEVDGSDIDVFDNNLLLSPSVYTITPIPGTEGGFVGGTLVLDSSVSNTTIIIIRSIDLQRITDFPTAGPFNINALNTDLDRLVAMVQQINQRAINDAVRVADFVTDSPNLQFSELAAERLGKVLGFDANGDIELQLGVGLWKDNWITDTEYVLRDVVRDDTNGANTKNLYTCVVTHTSGDWATDLAAANWQLMVDVESVTESEENAAASETAAGISETNAAASETAAGISETNAAASETAAGISETNAGVSETNAAASETAAGISETNAGVSETNAAASTGILEYTFDSSTSMVDPGSGEVRFNNATISSVTAIAFSNVTSGSGTPDVSDLLAAMDDAVNAIGGAAITFRKSGTPEVFATFYVTLVTDNTSWLQSTVNYVDGSGTLSASDTLMFSIAFSGTDGGGLASLLDDTSPQLANFLDNNGNYIGSGKGTDVASASPLVVGVDGDFFNMTGTTGFSGMIVAADRDFTFQFDGVLIITVGSGITLNNGGENFTTSPGDIIQFQSTAANTVTGVIFKADGTALTPSGRAWTLINSVEADSDASVIITGLDSTYAVYAILLNEVIPSNNGAALSIRVGDSSGIDEDGSDYVYHTSELNSGSASYAASISSSSAGIRLGPTGSAGTGGMGAVLFLHRSEGDTHQPAISGTITYGTTAGSHFVQGGSLVGRRTAVIDLDRVQIIFGSGTIVTGRFSIYGIDHQSA